MKKISIGVILVLLFCVACSNKLRNIANIKRTESIGQMITQMLTNHINSINGVHDSQISIEWPGRLFHYDEKPVSVTAILKMEKNSDVWYNEQKIKGIEKIFLVSIEGLKRDNIALYFDLYEYHKAGKKLTKNLESLKTIDKVNIEILISPFLEITEPIKYTVNVIIKPKKNSNIGNNKEFIRLIEEQLIFVFKNKHEDIKIMDTEGNILNFRAKDNTKKYSYYTPLISSIPHTNKPAYSWARLSYQHFFQTGGKRQNRYINTK
jgi:flagellar biosynthesis/type III secretory pathway M-ring protein FliF/YscJ